MGGAARCRKGGFRVSGTRSSVASRASESPPGLPGPRPRHDLPESAHQMVVALERKGLVAREKGKPRTIRVLVPPPDLPELE